MQRSKAAEHLITSTLQSPRIPQRFLLSMFFILLKLRSVRSIRARFFQIKAESVASQIRGQR